MLLNVMLLSGGLSVVWLITHWTLNPLRNHDPYWV